MSFFSILFQDPAERASAERREEPAYFHDLGLDQVASALVAGREPYELAPFFYARLHDVDGVAYRHEVVRDLWRKEVAALVRGFGARMVAMREQLAQAKKLRHRYQKQAWSLDAVATYADAAARLGEGLASVEVASRGLRGLREHLRSYLVSSRFRALVDEAKAVSAALGRIRYSLLIGNDRVTVRRYEEERDHASEVLHTFERFRRGEAQDYRVAYRDGAEMDHVEEQILDRVARLFPEEFGSLEAFSGRHADFVDPTLAAFDREVQFYLAYLEHVARLEAAGLRFCLPRVSESEKEELAKATFDLALAHTLVSRQAEVITNDLELREGERIFVVTGPNQGGKTTFARTFGQLHHLAALGLPVPGSEAALFLPDRILTHFERVERLEDLRGKLQDDLVRARAIVDEATGRSVVILNEIFTATTLEDALYLSTRLMERIVGLDLLCVWVTFVEEVSTMAPSVVSVTSMVRPDDPTVRTFKIVRRPAQGRAYAKAIASKYGLSYDELRERLSG